MRDRWIESDVLALPAGEHNYFERKSGALLRDSDFRRDMAKTLSALANSGGGHLILGARDDGTLDGVPVPHAGQTTTRDWLEQVIPHLLDYPLEDFRVHEVEPATPTSIPAGKVVVVIDVGDSALAPHQSSVTKTYYYRVGGRSVPAPHLYLETLRNRLRAPSLEGELVSMSVIAAYRHDSGIFVEIQLQFRVTNMGVIAAYKWALVVEGFKHSQRIGDYKTSLGEFPRGRRGRDSGTRIDDTILPGISLTEDRGFGFVLRPASFERADVLTELRAMLPAELAVSYRVVSEMSRGEARETTLLSVVDLTGLADTIIGEATS